MTLLMMVEGYIDDTNVTISGSGRSSSPQCMRSVLNGTTGATFSFSSLLRALALESGLGAGLATLVGIDRVDPLRSEERG